MAALLWPPNPGTQTLAVASRGFVDELALIGNRGSGKSTSMLLSYACDVKEFGAAWRGVIFRRESTEFQTLIDESKRIFYDCWKDQCQFMEDDMLWRWRNGATLQFVHMYRDSDVDSYVGQQVPFVGWTRLRSFHLPSLTE